MLTRVKNTALRPPKYFFNSQYSDTPPQRFHMMRVFVVVEGAEEQQLVSLFLRSTGVRHTVAGLGSGAWLGSGLELELESGSGSRSSLGAGSEGGGLSWLAAQREVHDFNCSRDSLSCVVVATVAAFQPPNIVPRLVDVAIILSENSMAPVDIGACFRTRLIAAGHTGDPITVIRVVARGTIEEATARAVSGKFSTSVAGGGALSSAMCLGGGLAALQGSRVGDVTSVWGLANGPLGSIKDGTPANKRDASDGSNPNLNPNVTPALNLSDLADVVILSAAPPLSREQRDQISALARTEAQRLLVASSAQPRHEGGVGLGKGSICRVNSLGAAEFAKPDPPPISLTFHNATFFPTMPSGTPNNPNPNLGPDKEEQVAVAYLLGMRELMGLYEAALQVRYIASTLYTGIHITL